MKECRHGAAALRSLANGPSARIRVNIISDALRRKEFAMINLLLIVGIVLVVLWLLGLVSSYTLGGYIHVALGIGLICVIVWAIGRFMIRA